MECEATRHGQYIFKPSLGAIKRKFSSGAGDQLRLDDALARSCAPAVPAPHCHMAQSSHETNSLRTNETCTDPFINNMDEITYWVITKRAPCLLHYNNLIGRQNGELTFSTPLSIEETSSPKKKKKRKLSILDVESDTPEKQNLYFEASQQKQKTVLSSCKSNSFVSDVDFNIKNSSVKDKSKKIKLQKNSRTTLHKKNRLATSTPKTTVLRRSLRRAQKTLNTTGQSVTIELCNPRPINTNQTNTTNNSKYNIKKSIDKLKKLSDKSLVEDLNHRKNEANQQYKKANGLFEDMSDVSGFTANYIRSTKMHSAKSTRHVRNKSTRNLIKESQQNVNNESTIVVCVNKSMNATEAPKVNRLNCSTDSSQNVVNLITVESNDNQRGSKVHRSTSLLKFIGPKNIRQNEEEIRNNLGEDCHLNNVNNKNVSFLSSNRTSRYPKRQKVKNMEENTTLDTTINLLDHSSFDKKRKANKNTSVFNNSDRKENPEEMFLSRTRSGRHLGQKLTEINPVLVVCNTTGPVSSTGTLNVATASEEDASRDVTKRKSTNCLKYESCTKTILNKCKHSLKRDKSGFGACFSDSDESEPLVQRKFFC